MHALLLIAAATAVTIPEVPNPRARGAWVSDLAEVIDAPAEARIEARVQALHDDLGVEIAVVTAPTVQGTPKDFATGLFEHWGVGSAGANDGLLVLLVVDARRLEMETGYGLEPALPDGWLGTMQAERMVPRFRDGDLGGGLEAGIEAVDARLRSDPDQAQQGTRSAIPTPRVAAPPDAHPLPPAWLWLVLGGVLGLGIWLGVRAWLRKRERTCPHCKREMAALGEAEDDAHLDPGQRTEERVGSVDWVVYHCDECDFLRVAPHRRLFSGYSRCKRCGNRTLLSTSHTEQQASYSHGGRVRVTEDCAHCTFRRSYTYSTPRKTRSTSSSSSRSGGFSSGGSSSSGSFGGGRSGGGGAGSSW